MERPLTNKEFKEWNKDGLHVKCEFKYCDNGWNLAGDGICNDNGEWNNPNCPKFKKATKCEWR